MAPSEAVAWAIARSWEMSSSVVLQLSLMWDGGGGGGGGEGGKRRTMKAHAVQAEAVAVEHPTVAVYKAVGEEEREGEVRRGWGLVGKGDAIVCMVGDGES